LINYGRTGIGDKEMDLVELTPLSDSELTNLIGAAKDVCVSLVMPLEQEPDKRAMNRIRLKNRLQAAHENLAQLDHRRGEIEELLAPAERLGDVGIPAGKGSGLAVYIAQDFSRAYRLPYVPQEVTVVSSHFQIKPLMPLRRDEQFYVLALSQEEVRLLRATRFAAQRVELGDMPQSMSEALQWDDPERELQWHSQTAAAKGGRAAIFHGHGVGTKETHKDDLLRYFQLLDQGLSKHLDGEEAPLLLAGIDYLLPIFRKANTYKRLIDQELTGSQEHLDDAEICRQAWELVRPYFQRGRDEAVSLFHQQVGKSLASAELTTVVPAAHQGRVDTLFVALDEQRWGQYNLETGQMDLHPHPQPGDMDLLNLATIHTVVNGGDVYVSQREDVPEDEPLAAILRF
jgi:hypothetical protein